MAKRIIRHGVEMDCPVCGEFVLVSFSGSPCILAHDADGDRCPGAYQGVSHDRQALDRIAKILNAEAA